MNDITQESRFMNRLKEIVPEADPENGRAIDDVYDLYQWASKIHSDVDITEDFTLSDLDDKEMKFVRKNVVTINRLRDFLMGSNIPKNINKRRLKKTIKKTINIMMMDVYIIVILSRAKNGRIIRSVLENAGGHVADEPERKNFMSKMKDALFNKEDSR